MKLRRLSIVSSLLLFGLSLVIPFVNPPAVFAAGEQYKWVNYNTVEATGGDFQGTTQLVYDKGSSLAGIDGFKGTVTHKSGCTIVLVVLVGNFIDTDGQLDIPPGGGSTCNASITNTYMGKGIDIAGDRSTPDVKVNITIWSPKSFKDSPDSILITIKQAGVSAGASTAVKKADTNGNAGLPAEKQAAYYEASPYFSLKQGEYTVCTNHPEILDCTNTTTGDYSSDACLTKSPNCYNFAVPFALNRSFTFNNRPTLVDSTSVCDGKSTSVELGWLVCGAIVLLSEGTQKFDNLVVDFLSVDTESVFNPSNKPEFKDSSEAFYKAWGASRNIAYGIIFLIGLVMIISQLAGLEVFSAYELRKQLPIIVLVLIAIPASWVGLRFFYGFSNDASFAIMDFIKGPFKDIEASFAITYGTVFGLGPLIFVLLSGGAAVGLGYLAILGLGGTLALVGSAALAAFSAWVLLSARNVVAYLLIVSAPIAIVAAAFGPIKKVFTIWRVTSLTVLGSVPIVAALIAVTHVAALIAFISGSKGIGTITAIIIWFGGYAMIWIVFTKVDSIAGQFGNIASSATGKLRKGLADYRQNQLKNRSRLWKQGALFSENSRLSGFNDIGRRLGAAEAINATKGGGGLTGAFIGRDRNALLANYDQVVREQRENDPNMKAIANYDDANAVLAGSGGIDTDESLARSAANAGLSGDRARKAISAARAMGVNRANAMTALRTALKNKGRAISPGNVRFMDQAVRALSTNEAEYDGLAQETAAFARASGRADLGGTDWISYATAGPNAGAAWQQARQVVAAEQQRRAVAGEAPMSGQQQEQLMWQSLSDSTILDGFSRSGAAAMVAGHDNQVIQVMDTLVRVLDTGSDQDRLQAAVALKELQGNMPAGASASVRDIINQRLYNARTPNPQDPTQPVGLGLNASGNIAQQLAERAGLRGAEAGQTLTTMGRTYGEYTGAAEANQRQAGNL